MKTLALRFRPIDTSNALFFDGALVLGASLLIALAAQIEIRLPFSPVPVSGQTFAVLLLGMLLGSRRGALAVLAYLGEGMLGLPVFSGGAAGFAHLAGPTGGYLLGFVAGAFVTGALAERGWDRHMLSCTLALVLGELAIYCLGLPWLAAFVGTGQVLELGFFPFIPAALVKIAALASILPLIWKFMRR